MHQEIIVREALQEDADSIINFQLAMALETENLSLDRTVTARGVRAVFRDPSKGKYYVAVEAGTIAGCMLTTPEWSDWRNRTVLWIQSVYVLPQYRKKGVFRRLFELLLEEARKDNTIGGIRLYVDRSNKQAQSVYTRLGMDGEHYQVFEWMK
jgi:ribosomal protein S18 acetylase RimI-like enzyme